MENESDDRTTWNNAWASMPYRRLENLPKIDVAGLIGLHLGELLSATISQDPPQYSDTNCRKLEGCPVCGATTEGTRRLPATLHPMFENNFTCGLGVWVHLSCFESCPDAEEPTPVPW